MRNVLLCPTNVVRKDLWRNCVTIVLLYADDYDYGHVHFDSLHATL